MGSGYRTQRTGVDAILERVTGQGRRIDQAAGAAPIRNSSITGGEGLTVLAPDGQAIQLKVVDDSNSQILFLPPTADVVEDWAAQVGFNPVGFAGGSLFLASPGSPDNSHAQPDQMTNVSLQSGDGLTERAALFVNVGGGVGGSMSLNVFGGSSTFGNKPRVEIGASIAFEDDGFSGTSARLFGGIASLVFPFATAEVRVRDNSDSAYVPIRASAFTVSSSREVKHDVTDLGWSAADVVARAKAYRWRYRPEHADPDRLHFGPMVEDLPDELVDRTGETPAVDLHALVGVLWAAVGELTARVAQLESER